MTEHQKNPRIEVPEEDLVEDFETDDQDEEQPILPETTKPSTVSEADWVDQHIDVPVDDDHEGSEDA